MTTLKMYGEGLGRLEQVSQGIVGEMCRSFLTEGGEGSRALNPKYILGRATGKVISSLVRIRLYCSKSKRDVASGWIQRETNLMFSDKDQR